MNYKYLNYNYKASYESKLIKKNCLIWVTNNMQRAKELKQRIENHGVIKSGNADFIGKLQASKVFIIKNQKNEFLLYCDIYK